MTSDLHFEREHLIHQIGSCYSAPAQAAQRPRETHLFPLRDILFQLYSNAILGTDYHSVPTLEKLYFEYCARYPQLPIPSLAELESKGWIVQYAGRWSSAALSSEPLGEKELTGSQDKNLILFLIWLQGQEQLYPAGIEIPTAKEIICQWQTFCPAVKPFEWFVESHFLEERDTHIYATNVYHHHTEIDEALALLWEHWGRPNYAKWLAIARELSGSNRILSFLTDPCAQELLACMVDTVFFKNVISEIDAFRQFDLHALILKDYKYTDHSATIDRTNVRVFDFLSDALQREALFPDRFSAFAVDAQLLLQSILQNLGTSLRIDSEQCIRQLNACDYAGLLSPLGLQDAPTIFELMATPGTFFLGFRFLVQNAACALSDGTRFAYTRSTVIELCKSVLNAQLTPKNSLNPEDIFSCLLYLCAQSRRIAPPYALLLDDFVALLGTEKFLCALGHRFVECFTVASTTQAPVHRAQAMNLLLKCLNAWCPPSDKLQALPIFAELKELCWDGYQSMFKPTGSPAPYLDLTQMTSAICQMLYEKNVQGQRPSLQESFFYPISHNGVVLSRNELRYQYLLLLTVLCHLDVAYGDKDSAPHTALIHNLETALLCPTPVFPHELSPFLPFNTLIASCINLLHYDREPDKALLKVFLDLDFPTLLAHYSVAKDPGYKSELEKAIACRCKEDSTIGDSLDEDAINNILDNRLQCAYPAAEQAIDEKLATLKRRNTPPALFSYVRNQYSRLLYNEERYEEILNGDDAFFKAIIYMEVNRYKSAREAASIWKSLIAGRTTGPVSSKVYLNYLLLLYREYCSNRHDSCLDLETEVQQLTGLIESSQIRLWSDADRTEYCLLAIKIMELQGHSVASAIFDYTSKFQVKLALTDFVSQKMPDAAAPSAPLGTDEISTALCYFYTMMPQQMSQTYYKCLHISAEAASPEMLLVDTVLHACSVLQFCSPQLVIRAGAKPIMEEDAATIVFREIYNHANTSRFKLQVSDQEKRGSTGHTVRGHASPGEVDLTFSWYNGLPCSVAEAFVLRGSSTATFKDHMGKVIGNNVGQNSVSFVFVYGISSRLDLDWSAYKSYLENSFSSDFKGVGVQRNEFPDFKKAPYYASFLAHNNLTVFRQVIQLSSPDGATQREILHVLIDMRSETNERARLAGSLPRRQKST